MSARRIHFLPDSPLRSTAAHTIRELDNRQRGLRRRFKAPARPSDELRASYGRKVAPMTVRAIQRILVEYPDDSRAVSVLAGFADELAASAAHIRALVTSVLHSVDS